MSKLQRRQRRQIRFESTTDIFSDIEQLQSGGWETTGDWTLGQIVMHLAMALEEVFNGLDFKPPWFVRTFVAPLLKRRFLNVGMMSGYKIPNPESKVLPADNASLDDALARFQRGCERIENESPQHPHPLLGNLTHEEWKLLTLRHAELHLSFAHPHDSNNAES